MATRSRHARFTPSAGAVIARFRGIHRDPETIPIEQKVALLRTPSTYGRDVRAVQAIETHMSWVFLTERHAFKLKKPVWRNGLDYRTVAARRRNCELEVVLNSRLAASVYLGIVPLTADGRLALGGVGEPVDWLVKMRRLPANTLLDAQIARGDVDAAAVGRAAETLAAFYRRAQPAGVTGAAYVGRLAGTVERCRAELCHPRYGLRAAEVDAVTEPLLHALRAHPARFEARAGRVIDAHGDLRPEHVCLEDEPVFIDCLEFDRELRLLDPASELAFLALECSRLGAPALGDVFLAAYRRATGDPPPQELLAFYRGQHAAVRALLAARHLVDPDIDDHDRWRTRAHDYLVLGRRAGTAHAVAGDMRVADIMNRFPRTVAPTDDLGLASAIMIWGGFRHLPVVRDGELVGVLSQRDVLVYQAVAEREGDDWRTKPVTDAMRANPQTCATDDSVTEVAARMADAKIGCLPVTDKRKLVGLVTVTGLLEHSVRSALQPVVTGPSAEEVMTPNPETVHPDDHLLDAAARMAQLQIRHLPVVDGEGALLGMLSDRDVRAAIGAVGHAFDRSLPPVVQELRASDAMSRPGVSVRPDERCADVARYFADLGVSAVAVTDERNRLLGVLSYVDLLRAMTQGSSAVL